MNRDLLKSAGIGVVICIVFVGIVLFWTRGAHVVLEGSVQKVRTHAMDEKSVVAVIDFRFVNSSDHPFIVRKATVILEDQKGNLHQGMTVAEVDAKRLFQYYPLLGQKYNDSLKIRDRVESGESMDRMISARFEFPEEAIGERKRLIIRVEDVDGAISRIAEE